MNRFRHCERMRFRRADPRGVSVYFKWPLGAERQRQPPAGEQRVIAAGVDMGVRDICCVGRSGPPGRGKGFYSGQPYVYVKWREGN